MWILPWNPYGIVHEFDCKFIGNSMESTGNPHGLAHGMSMEWSIPYGYHMDSIVGME